MSDATTLRRRDRLREELRDAGVRLDLDPPTGLQTLDEISYARFPRRHERKLPTYGAFVVSDDVVVHRLGGVVIDGSNLSVDTLRLMADGRRSYLVVGSHLTGLVVFPTAYDRETDIVRLIDASRNGRGIVVVQRLTDGLVRILGLDGLVIWDGARWRNKPYARAFLADILRRTRDCPRPALEAILEFCVHDLGPAPTGAILVWDLRGRGSSEALGHVRRPRQPLLLPALSLLDPSSHPAVRSLLGQVDGAVLLDRDATVVEAGTRLMFSERAERLVKRDVDRGTRHASARRFSFDERDTVVFVVSEDGPLTVYAHGDPIARLDSLYWSAMPRPPDVDERRPTSHAAPTPLEEVH